MERTDDFCFETIYLRSNRNQLREKKMLKKKNWSTITQSNNTKVNFKCFKQKQELSKRTNVMSNNITKNKPKGKDSSGLD